MNKFFKMFSNGILILTIVILSAYFVLRLANVIRIYNVETGSMEDKIHAGDYILLFRKNNYYVGDVVTYKVKKYFITHRIIKIENDKVITKGDANNLEDAEITKDQIEGKVIYWGGILNFVINYKFVVIAFLLGLYLLSCYLEDGSESKKKKKKSTTNIKQDEIIIDNSFDDIIDKDDDVKEEAIEKPIAVVNEEKTEEVIEEKIEEIKPINENMVENNNSITKPKQKKTTSKKKTTNKKTTNNTRKSTQSKKSTTNKKTKTNNSKTQKNKKKSTSTAKSKKSSTKKTK